jgi:AraC family transcriptional regulator
VFTDDVAGAGPRLVELEHPIRVVGLFIDTSLRTIYRDVPALGRRFRAYTRSHPIRNKAEPWAFAAVSMGYDKEKSTFRNFMRDVVAGADRPPSGLSEFEIPAMTYAIFPVRPRNRFGWGLAIANVKRCAYDEWLPNSSYEPAGVIDDFEYHDERSTRRQHPEVDLYVAIREKRA